jgi:hypothetical protein
MRLILRITLLLVCLASMPSLAQAAMAADTPEARQQAAERLFDLPAYRQTASRQVYEAIRSLPDEQYRGAEQALNDPKVVQLLRAVIVRSMAQTFTVAELDSLARYLATDEARSAVGKTDAFQDALLRELLAAGLTHPELGRYLMPR